MHFFPLCDVSQFRMLLHVHLSFYSLTQLTYAKLVSCLFFCSSAYHVLYNAPHFMFIKTSFVIIIINKNILLRNICNESTGVRNLVCRVHFWGFLTCGRCIVLPCLHIAPTALKLGLVATCTWTCLEPNTFCTCCGRRVTAWNPLWRSRCRNGKKKHL